MKICFIANVNSIHARRWIEPIIAQGNHVYILSYRPDASPLDGTTEFVDLTQLTNTPKIRFAQWGWWIRKYVRRVQPDILHAHQLQAAGWMGVLAGFHPFVVSGWGSDILVEPHRSSFRRLLVRFVLNQSDYLTVPSKMMYTATSDLGYPEERIHLIPWGVDSTIFTPTPEDRLETIERFGLPRDGPILLSPRRIAPVCNIDVILAAAKELLPTFPNLRLALIRFNPVSSYLIQLERKISEYGLDDSLLWLPPQPTPIEMAKLYRAVRRRRIHPFFRRVWGDGLRSHGLWCANCCLRFACI